MAKPAFVQFLEGAIDYLVKTASSYLPGHKSDSTPQQEPTVVHVPASPSVEAEANETSTEILAEETTKKVEQESRSKGHSSGKKSDSRSDEADESTNNNDNAAETIAEQKTNAQPETEAQQPEEESKEPEEVTEPTETVTETEAKPSPETNEPTEKAPESNNPSVAETPAEEVSEGFTPQNMVLDGDNGAKITYTHTGTAESHAEHIAYEGLWDGQQIVAVEDNTYDAAGQVISHTLTVNGETADHSNPLADSLNYAYRRIDGEEISEPRTEPVAEVPEAEAGAGDGFTPENIVVHDENGATIIYTRSGTAEENYEHIEYDGVWDGQQVLAVEENAFDANGQITSHSLTINGVETDHTNAVADCLNYAYQQVEGAPSSASMLPDLDAVADTVDTKIPHVDLDFLHLDSLSDVQIPVLKLFVASAILVTAYKNRNMIKQLGYETETEKKAGSPLVEDAKEFASAAYGNMRERLSSTRATAAKLLLG
jgi:hypothetical protein